MSSDIELGNEVLYGVIPLVENVCLDGVNSSVKNNLINK